jgi:release factor glutamine methyltransferase
MTVHAAYESLKQQLLTIYSEGESAAIAEWVIEHITGLRHNRSNNDLSADSLKKLNHITDQLMHHRPVQYATGTAYFGPLQLFVDESVLIPRPETEELVAWIVASHKNNRNVKILDIGTGSGCIALLLKHYLPEADIFALDFSKDSLAVAAKNAQNMGFPIQFIEADILAQPINIAVSTFDLIVSNPPYISAEEKSSMEQNVLNYEPHSALFVHGNDPLQFYKAIEQTAQQYLDKKGALFCELNHLYASQTQQYFQAKGWNTTLKTDMQGKNRMLRAQR